MSKTLLIKSPYRISFFGGGTDFPEFFNEHPSSVLSTSIDKYCRVSCRKLPPFFDHKYRFVYSKIECVNSRDEIQHPSIKATLEYLNILDGLEIQHFGDLPARSGIGSSSAFTSAIVKAILSLYEKEISKQELAELTIHIEREINKEAVGMQDQIAVTHGGFNEIKFSNNNFLVREVNVHKEKLKELENSLLLFFTGTQRNSEYITKEHIKGLEKNKLSLKLISSIADHGIRSLESEENIEEFGRLLDETWQIKRNLTSGLTNQTLDEIYTAALEEGAYGGKLLGAGGGGFILFAISPQKKERLLKRLSRLVHVPFKFENSGTSIM